MGWYVVHMTSLHRAAVMDAARRHQPHRAVAVRVRPAHVYVRMHPTGLILMKMLIIEDHP